MKRHKRPEQHDNGKIFASLPFLNCLRITTRTTRTRPNKTYYLPFLCSDPFLLSGCFPLLRSKQLKTFAAYYYIYVCVVSSNNVISKYQSTQNTKTTLKTCKNRLFCQETRKFCRKSKIF